MTRLTGMIIQTRGEDIVCTAGGPGHDGTHYGFVELHRDGEYDHVLITLPTVYKSEEAALTAATELVREVRAMEL